SGARRHGVCSPWLSPHASLCSCCQHELEPGEDGKPRIGTTSLGCGDACVYILWQRCRSCPDTDGSVETSVPHVRSALPWGRHPTLSCYPPRGVLAVKIMPDFGTMRENKAAFDVAVASITSGEIAWGRLILAALRDHIWQTEEQKSIQWILPKVLATLEALKTCTPT